MTTRIRNLSVSVAATGIAALTALASCGDASTQFDVHYASDFPRTAPLKVSVFGVFRDGRLNAEAWNALGKNLSMSLASNGCEIVYGDPLIAQSPDTASALDEFTRANGVTDDLLDLYGPKAQGDTILLVTMAGRPPQPLSDKDTRGGASAAPSPAMGSMRGRGPGRGMPGGPMPTAMGPGNTDQNVFVMAASLYSVTLHKSVAEVGMTYSGKSMDEAVKSFQDKLASELHGATCVGWKTDVSIDAAKINGIQP
jgi:hypothetical protein